MALSNFTIDTFDDEISNINDDLFNYAEGIVRAIAINYGIAYEEPIDIKNKTHIVTKGESLYSIAKKLKDIAKNFNL